MQYKLYKSKQEWKIYDIEIQGVSLISTYRSQFDEILRNKTIDDLLVKLEKPENK
jgi:phospholipid transport system substrate-binding protein